MMVKIMLEISENQFYPFHPCSQLASHSEATKMSTLFNLRPLDKILVQLKKRGSIKKAPRLIVQTAFSEVFRDLEKIHPRM
jgi:hypothetical protein